MRFLLLLAILMTLAGCAVKKVDKKIADYNASMPNCTINGNEIDCDWDNVPDME